MRLKDLQIGTQLRLGLGLIMVLVLGLGVLSWRQADELARQTNDLFEHPLQVHRAVGRLEADVERMSRHVRELRQAQDQQGRETILHQISLGEVSAEKQLELLRDRYLGPEDDVDTLESDLLSWKVQRDETIRLMGTGGVLWAEHREGGVQAERSTAVMVSLKKIDTFADNMSNTLHRRATDKAAALQQQLFFVVGLILLLSLSVSWLLLNGIKRPLTELTATAAQLGQGNLEVRSLFASKNEVGTLSKAFNTLADSVQANATHFASAADLNATLLEELEARAFGVRVLETLMRLTASQIGAVYVLDEERGEYMPLKSIGLSGDGHSFSASAHEGEFGAALASRSIQRISDIPTDTHFTFATVSGEFRPREIVTIPLVSGKEIPAVVSLASLRDYRPAEMRFLTQVQPALTTWLNAMLSNRRIAELSAGLEAQNLELEAQKEELEAQASQLAEHNAELEIQKRQVDEANRLKSAFLSNMSHELRTPLNSVIALSSVLSRRLEMKIPDEEWSYLEVIERNGKNLLALINDVLDLSRLEAGQEDLRVERFSLRGLVGELVDMLAPIAGKKGVALDNQVPEGLIESDADKCRHILQNLIGNAVKFTDVGQVSIAATFADHAVGLTGTDTGIGIAPDKLDLIFEEFRQADDSTSRRQGGTGLGLTIARRYAHLLGGEVGVESKLGAGSTFTVRLPLTATHGAVGVPSRTRPRAKTPTPNSRRGQRLLLIEDSEPAVIQMCDILRAEGYQVEVARNGKMALEMLEHIAPEAVILDLMMPEVDGFQVLGALRAVPKTATLPVLILTAKHVTKQELSFLEGNHIHQLIRKGDVDKERLLAAVAGMVEPDEPRKPSDRRVAPTRKPRRPGKPVVLVVEDDPDNLRTAKALLEDNYVVVSAQDGQEGLEQARRHLPDVILMDLAMPVLDGFEALKALHRDETLKEIPVFAVTASAMTGDRESILAHGFDGYLSKPLDGEILKKTLAGLFTA